MADRKPLVLIDGVLGQIPDTDILTCQTYATQIVGLDSVTKEIIGLNCVQDSTTIHWSFDSVAEQLKADVIELSLTNAHISDTAAIEWTKIDKTGASLADLPTRHHNDLQAIQGGSVDSYYHLTLSEHDLLTTQQDASSLHNHNNTYYTQTQLSTAGQSVVDWDNISNTPSSYPPSPHTHTASDITDLVYSVQNIVGAFVAKSDSVSWLYDTDGHLLYANVIVTDSDTIQLSVGTIGIIGSVIDGSLTNVHISDTANIDWSKISKTGSALNDIDDVDVSTIAIGNSIIWNGTNFVPADLATSDSLNDHKTAPVIDHPDKSITAAKLADDIDASSIGFVADKVDGADLNDAGATSSDLWSASKIITYVNNQVQSKITWLSPVLDNTLCTPPATPNDGDRYIICDGTATGDWAGYENCIAEYDASTSTWNITTPLPEDVVYVESDDKIYGYDGSIWQVRFSAINDHEQLSDLLGGAPNEHYHVTALEHDKLVKGLDASSLHNHNSTYYTQTQLQTSGQSIVDWGNISNTPATYPPSPHTHTASDITDFDTAVEDDINNYIINSDTIAWTVGAGNISASIVPGSVGWNEFSFTLIPWDKIDTTGSKLCDLDNVVSPTGDEQILVHRGSEWVSENIRKAVDFIPYHVLTASPKLIASTTYPIPILLNGFNYKGTPTNQNQDNISQIYYITSPFDFTNIDQGRLLSSSWYSMFIVVDPTTNDLVGCLSLMHRINSVVFNSASNTSTIVLGKQTDPTTVLTTTTIEWNVDNYATTSGSLLSVTGGLEGQTFTIISNTTSGQAAITVEGDLSSLQQGDWILLSPQAYDKYKYIGEAFCENNSPIEWRTGYSMNRNHFIYDNAYPFYSGQAQSITPIDLTTIVPPTAVSLEMCEYTASNINTTFYLDSGGTQICKQLNMSGYFIFYLRQSCDRIPINVNSHSLFVYTSSATFYTRGYCYGN